MSKRVFVPPGCVSCELVMVDVGFLFITACKLFPSAECVWFCIPDFTVCFENLPRWMSIKVTTTRKKMASPEEKKKKYFAHVVAILNDSFERALEQDGCICKPLTVKDSLLASSPVWASETGLARTRERAAKPRLGRGKESLQRSLINFHLYFSQTKGNTIG